MVKSLAAVWETWVQSLGQGDPLEKECDSLQYSCLENLMDGGGAWQAAVYGVAKSWTRLRNFTLDNQKLYTVYLPFCLSEYHPSIPKLCLRYLGLFVKLSESDVSLIKSMERKTMGQLSFITAEN